MLCCSLKRIRYRPNMLRGWAGVAPLPDAGDCGQQVTDIRKMGIVLILFVLR